MPVYHYDHSHCGMNQDFYLKQDVDSKVVACERCGGNVTARQVRNKGQFEGTADGTTGIMQRELKNNGHHRRRK